MMLQQKLAQFPRIILNRMVTPIEKLPRLSEYLKREIYIKRDDIAASALGGNKLRKLEFLVADALAQGADTLVTAGAIQSNHVRQTAGVAAKLGLHCVALLENSVASEAENYLTNGNRLLLDLFNAHVVLCDSLSSPQEQLQELALRLELQGFRPYIVPVGGSNALGVLGYVQCALELGVQSKEKAFSAIVVASGSAGTQAGLSIGLQEICPECELVGVTVSRNQVEQREKVKLLQNEAAHLLNIAVSAPIILWDEYFAPQYGVQNDESKKAIKLLAELEGIVLDPVYTGKAMAGLMAGVLEQRFASDGPILFIHTGGVPALFAYHPTL